MSPFPQFPVDERAIAEAAARDAVTVLSQTWEGFPYSDPPSLVAELSTGAALKVRWDLDYAHRVFFLYTGDRSVAVAVTGPQTGLPNSVLERLTDEAHAAAHEWAREQDDGSDNDRAYDAMAEQQAWEGR